MTGGTNSAREKEKEKPLPLLKLLYELPHTCTWQEHNRREIDRLIAHGNTDATILKGYPIGRQTD